MELDGNWRPLTIPFQSNVQLIESVVETQLCMDALKFVSGSPVEPLETDLQKERSGMTACSCHVKSFASSSKPNSQRQFRRKTIANRICKLDGLVTSSGQNRYSANENVVTITCGPDATISSDMVLKANKEIKSTARSSRKKPKKRGRRIKNLLGNTGHGQAECTPKSCSGFSKKLDQQFGYLSQRNEFSPAEHRRSTGPSAVNSESLVLYSGNKFHTQDSEFRILSGLVRNRNSELIAANNDSSPVVYTESLDSKRIENSLAKLDIVCLNNEDDGRALSDSPGHATTDQNCSSDVKTGGSSRKANGNKQDCIDNDRYLDKIEGRERQHSRARSNLNIARISSSQKLHGSSRRDSVHLVWQKVRKNEANKHNSGFKKVKILSQSDLSSKDTPFLNKHHDFPCTTLSKSEDIVQKKFKTSGKVKRKITPRSKQECISYSRKETHSKIFLDLHTETNMQQTETMSVTSQLSLSKILGSQLVTNTPEDGFKDETSEACVFRPHHSSRVCYSKPDAFESCNSAVSALNSLSTRAQNSSLSRSSNVWDPSLFVEKPFAEGPNTHADDTCAVSDEVVFSINDITQRLIGRTDENSSTIIHAVDDAYRAQLASEAMQRITGCPIAEFEKLLQLASPSVRLPNDNATYQACLHGQEVAASLCRHEIPHISLLSLWQWYEKHGNYGLEVRAQDYGNPKRIGMDCFAFRAYFVPYLSAIQLFKQSKSCLANSENKISGVEQYKRSDASRLSLLSILSQPSSNDGQLPSEDRVHEELTSMHLKDNTSTHSVDSLWPNDVEVVFEYFESEQPQRRRPFFETIMGLLNGDGPSKCRTFGNPATLDSVGLLDLHPNSWYSVAWYPIYRIPDGNFRAAFLTYHSLGHLVHLRPPSDSLCLDSCVISPVVGLESYNAQSECWFQPRYSVDNQTSEGMPYSEDPLDVLRERLRTLERTASVMARAVISKGHQTCSNNQPDYEFFLSRRR